MAKRRRKRNPSSSAAATEAARLVKRYGQAEAVRVARAVVEQRGVPVSAKAHWRAVLAVLRMHRNPRRRKVARKRNPARARSSSRAGQLLAFTVKRGGRAVGTVVARTAAAAAKEAKAAGLRLGSEVKSEFCKNPPHGATLSRRAEALTYQHAADGEWYRHKWAPGVVVKVSPDRKRVTLFRPDGKPVAGEFDVP